jgi:predicted acylesterase/phospholipase RssA
MPNGQPKKRSLILAGGGMKVGFQAGVLQVWLDEAGLEFDHADGASGGCFNLAMYCQGMSGTQIADNWRNLNPFLPVDFNLEQYWKLLNAPSILSYDNFRKNVLPFWGIDWNRIQQSDRVGTFNVFNFSKKQLEVIPNDRMSEDLLIASVSLPMWFPPVQIFGQTYFDAVYISDANVEEAIRRGADEIWAIWTVSTRDEWLDGFVAQYFQIIETVADTNFFGIWKRIERNNEEITAGRPGEFGRKIALKLLQAEVPVHYLFNLSKDRMAESVNLGVQTARQWCREQGVNLKPGSESPTDIHTVDTRLQFTEEMKGHVGAGESDPESGWLRGKKNSEDWMFHLAIKVEGVNRFVSNPTHEAAAEGWVNAGTLGKRLPVEKGVFNLFTHKDDPNEKQMLYRLFFHDKDGKPYTLSGHKIVKDDAGQDVWTDTTTLFTKIFEGHVDRAAEAAAPLYGAGVLRIYMMDFLRQLTTFRVEGPTVHDRVAALNRFGKLFLGKLWDVYGRRVLEYGPL